MRLSTPALSSDWPPTTVVHQQPYVSSRRHHTLLLDHLEPCRWRKTCCDVKTDWHSFIANEDSMTNDGRNQSCSVTVLSRESLDMEKKYLHGDDVRTQMQKKLAPRPATWPGPFTPVMPEYCGSYASRYGFGHRHAFKCHACHARVSFASKLWWRFWGATESSSKKL